MLTWMVLWMSRAAASMKSGLHGRVDAALADNGAYQKLSYLCDRIGNRLARLIRRAANDLA